MARHIIGVDIGGQSIKAGAVINGEVIKFSTVATEAEKSQKKVLENITHAIGGVFSKDIGGIGIGCPGGPIDYGRGIVYNAVNLPFRNANLVNYFSKIFRVPILLDNDANVFTLGEAIYGAGKRYRSVLGVTLGTGVGGGIVIDGRIEHGRGNAGEIGHMKLNYINGRKCHCGKKGCIEAYVSADGIVETAREHGLGISSPNELYEMAFRKNLKAKEAWKKTGEYLGAGLSSAINLLDPDIIVVGGGISKAWEFFSESMVEYAIKESFSTNKTKIAKAKLEYPGIVGAAALFAH